jgi:hypothetical protein
MEQYQKQVHDQLQQRFAQTSTLGRLALLLDPRTKHFTTGNKFRQDCEHVLEIECAHLIKRSSTTVPAKNSPSPSSTTPVENSKKRKRSILRDALDASKKFAVVDTSLEYAQLEVHAYLKLPILEEDKNPLLWWKEHEHLFPHLQQLAKKYLSIPATSAPSERLFSVGGNIVTDKRHSLSAQHVRALIFLHDNFDLLMQ